MSLFSGLEKLGLKNLEDVDEIEKKKNKEAAAAAAAKPVEVKKETDFLFDRHYTCPVCDIEFTSRSVKASGVKAVDQDTDLRPIYDVFDPLKYDAISCDKCGYSAISRYFKTISIRQTKMIKEQVSTSFAGLENALETYSYDDAIIRHKLALVCSVVKRAKNSERAYTSLKLAWILRAKRQTLNFKDENQKEEIKSLYLDELECIKNAYEGFNIAMSSEEYPIAGMDEMTMKYLMSDLARKLKKFDVALKFTGDIITSKGAANRIKDKALQQKELIKHDMQAVAAK
jgi:hypothetical protein